MLILKVEEKKKWKKGNHVSERADWTYCADLLKKKKSGQTLYIKRHLNVVMS